MNSCEHVSRGLSIIITIVQYFENLAILIANLRVFRSHGIDSLAVPPFMFTIEPEPVYTTIMNAHACFDKTTHFFISTHCNYTTEPTSYHPAVKSNCLSKVLS